MKRLILVTVLAALLGGACGDGAGDGGGAGDVSLLAGSDRAAPDAGGGPTIAAEAITSFGVDLFSAVRSLPASDGANVVVSPASVGIALAMVEPGAVDAGSIALRELLRIDDPETFHASMNALEQNLEARKPQQVHNAAEKPGELAVRIVNAAYLQRGYPFERSYVDAVTRSYGPVLNEVDFSADPDAVAHEINDFVAAETRNRITDLVPDGALSDDTVFALVNALYLKASWLSVFDPSATADGTFTLLDGGEIQVPLMQGFGDSSAKGDHWVAATKSYVGGLAAQFILPDEGHFDEVAADLAGVFADYDADRTSGAQMVVPRFESRFYVELPEALRRLGLGALFDEEAQLLGIAPDERLKLDEALHETFIALDEEGTEAAAATVITGVVTSGPLTPPVPVVLDRPFLFRIIDMQTGVTLFVGQIVDPS